MALVWSHQAEGNLYELRSAGASLRLYRNGVNHSQWNPDRPLSGSIWDLIALPALHRPVGSLESALMLGFGAGTVARQLCDLAAMRHIVGVELDPMHLSIAQGFFDCDDRCELIAGDAVEWIQDEAGETRYDLIIDDLYGEEDGIPERYAPMDLDWFARLTGLLNPGGILVLNTIEPERISTLPMLRDKKFSQELPCHIMYHIDGYENRVLAFSAEPFDVNAMEAALRSICRQYPRCYGVAKRYKMTQMKRR